MAKKSPHDLNSDMYYCCDINRFHDNSICPYLHVKKDSDLKKVDTRRIVCSFYLARVCKYDDNCIFAHFCYSESQEGGNNAEEVVQEEPNTFQNNLDESLPEIEQSENSESHLSEHPKKDCLESVNCNLALEEQLEQILNFEENEATDETNRTNNNVSSPTKEFLIDSEENLEIGDFLNENLNGQESMTENVGVTNEDTSFSQLNKVDDPSVKYLESVEENHFKKFDQNELGNENNNEEISDSHQELITANESFSSQNSLLDLEVDATSQPSNNVNEEHEPLPTVSDTKECGICQESIGPGQNSKVFGILPNCNHIFCLDCIKKWREQANSRNDIAQAAEDGESSDDSDSSGSWEDADPVINNVDPKIARSCPLCRTASNFVVPGLRWVEGDAEKDELVASYKAKTGKINCKYFVKDGICKFGRHCFYMHAAFYCKQFERMFRYHI